MREQIRSDHDANIKRPKSEFSTTCDLYSMFQLLGRSLITHSEAYSKSLERFFAAQESRHPTLECIEEHVVTLICDYVWHRLEDQSPFCILSVGSGDGGNDLAFLEILSKPRRDKNDKVKFFERSIEPDKKMLESFRAKADHLPGSLMSKANIEFEWHVMTFQEYVEQTKKDDVKFDVVHFFHSLYYTGREMDWSIATRKNLGQKELF